MFPCRLINEWISMNSNRLRPIENEKHRLRPIEKVEKEKPVPHQFAAGDRCLARWNDSRKFPATVQKILENSEFAVEAFSRVPI